MAVYDRNPASKFRVILEGALEARKKLVYAIRQDPWGPANGQYRAALVRMNDEIEKVLDQPRLYTS